MNTHANTYGDTPQACGTHQWTTTGFTHHTRACALHATDGAGHRPTSHRNRVHNGVTGSDVVHTGHVLVPTCAAGAWASTIDTIDRCRTTDYATGGVSFDRPGYRIDRGWDRVWGHMSSMIGGCHALTYSAWQHWPIRRPCGHTSAHHVEMNS